MATRFGGRVRLAMEEGSQAAGHVLLHGCEHVRVDAECHLDVLVTETLLHNLRRNSGLQQRRG